MMTGVKSKCLSVLAGVLSFAVLLPTSHSSEQVQPDMHDTLQAALDRGESLTLPPGITRISKALLVQRSGITITGSPPGSTLLCTYINALGDGSRCLTIGKKGEAPTEDITISHLTFKNVGETHVKVDAGVALLQAIDGAIVRRLSISDCIFVTHNRGSVALGADLDTFRVERCRFVECGESPIYLAGVSSRNGVIADNVIIGPGQLPSLSSGIRVKSATNLIITRNVIEDWVNAGIQLADYPNHNIIITENIIRRMPRKGACGIYSNTKANQVIVANNIIDTINGNGIQFGIVTSGQFSAQAAEISRSVKIANNMVIRTGGWGIIAGPTGDAKEGITDVFIENNTLLNCDQGIHANRCKGMVRVSGNSITTDTPGSRPAFYMTNGILAHNAVRGYGPGYVDKAVQRTEDPARE